MAARRRGRLRPGGALLALLGCVLIALGAFHLAATEERLTCALPMNGVEDVPERVTALTAKMDAVRTQLSGAVSTVAMAGLTESAGILADGDSLSVGIVAADAGWFDGESVRILQGRGLMESELSQGARVALLSEALAFRLYGAQLPEDATVDLGSLTCRVVGTVRWTRGPGDAAEHRAWLPLKALIVQDEENRQEMAVKLDALLLEAVPLPGAGAPALFESTARTLWAENGDFINLKKEAMRGTIVLRALLLVMGLRLWFIVLRHLTDAAAVWVGRYRQALRKDYFVRTLPRLLAMLLGFLLGLALLIGAAWLLLRLVFAPMSVFPEWIPENITAWSSLESVFWNLIGGHARLVRVGTPALRETQFWAALVRWGAIALLCGLGVGVWKREA